ncbi:helix-hairpin-helix domain-containing protein [uncultured Bacteroides sp.]|uniref:helix-hairpin-helix domain-containing protein n=1 Tax=uncultured Bacteroides sp. TaxID=162156 RepID=UPI002AA8CCC6|nr:helix-hairpin-helix domain-containing protein [uncultured Bacteroides sp.]
MNYIKAILVAFVSQVFIVLNFRAQTVVTNSWEDVIEELSENDEGEELDWENELEELSYRIQEPVNLNNVTKEQLEQFPFLSDLQIENLLAYLYINGQMQTIYELQLVDGMDKETIQYLLPYVCVKPVEKKEPLPSLKDILGKGKNELITRFDIPFYSRKGYESSYLGPSVYHSLRYGFHYKETIYWGFTGEKDAGEPFFALHNQKGYDYYSFYFLLKNIRKLKALALGNYKLSFGQGLVIGSDYMMGKTVSTSTIGTRSSGIRKHSSTDEYNYLSGAAATVGLGDFALSAFYSHRSLDGIATDSVITSINKTGLHRTQKEADRSHLFTTQLMGGNISYSKDNLKIGATGIYYFFDRPYEPQIREYSKYNIRGNRFYNLGIDYKYRWNRFTFVGEAAIGKGGGIATLNTIKYSPSGNYNLMMVHRYYAYNYWAMYGHSFSEGGYVQNENGWYFGADITPFQHWKFFASADFFSFPWLKYGIDRPSSGFDGIMQATYSPFSNLSMYLRYRYKRKDKNYTDADKVKTVRPLHHHSLRYRLSYSVSSRLLVKTTIDYNHLHPQEVKASQGFQFVQMLSYHFRQIPLACEIQGAWFHTDDYASRVYSYEKGMLYSFYIPSFYGIGTHLAFHLRYDIYKNWMVMAKIGQTRYNDRNEIGSGLDIIEGNKKTDAQIQLRYKF